MMHASTEQLQNKLIHTRVKADHSPMDTAFLPVLLSSDEGKGAVDVPVAVSVCLDFRTDLL